MELGIFSRTYQPIGIDRIFAQIAQDGFQTYPVQFLECGAAFPPEGLARGDSQGVMASASQSGLTICALSGTYNMAHPDVARRRSDRIGFTNVVRAAEFMQVPLVTLCTGSRDAHEHVDGSSGQRIS